MYPKLIENLIDKLTKLPGIGRRSAERIIYWMLACEPQEIKALADNIQQLKEGLRFCKQCNHLSEQDLCLICMDPNRDRKTICVVESPKDLLAIERTGSWRGIYYVLLGNISPSEGRGPDDLNVTKLVDRIKDEGIAEVVIATDPDAEGEMTALYLGRELKKLGVRVSRIGLGIPVGSSVEYVDVSTLTMSMNSRRVVDF
ncbi:MAG: recombination mediator RecR [Candidatus Omnitrophica bacterium]|nr:recombination mediator RecR [Candidatus Omnitrophota bacterium]MDE2008864.1 recombination mediator RecR [Candidatus Omnitrophota bacterium]MDE2213573.1 recombination mediator RecR [Candidatus Omnitrophota bacterium]MDE2230526.1 recombination mediator RecR [Candidatus Omnitrophota bacterium]